MREFATGATRSSDAGKLDYEGFLDPLVLEAYAHYMDVNRTTEDGTQRSSDNWQKGIPKDQYGKSGYRHFIDFAKILRGHKVGDGELGAIGGILFNVMGWVHERIKEDPDWLRRELSIYVEYREAELEARVKARENNSATRPQSA